MDVEDKKDVEVACSAALLAALGQTFNETDPSFRERLERNCDRLFRLLGEGDSRNEHENKAARTLSLAGHYLREIETAEKMKSWGAGTD